METEKFSVSKRAKSFRYAFQGLRQFFATQHNALIHAAATVLVVIGSIALHLPLSKLLFIIVAVGLVWVAELFNTAIEKLCDIVCPQQDPRIKFIKDVSAAAVLITAVIAVATAGIIFIPVLL
ncbi:MAG: diacylglycerol kinase family protein [Bacteroidota bacterium]